MEYLKMIRYKFTLIGFLFFFSISHAHERTIICGKVKSSENFNVHIYEPLFGYSNSVFFDSTIHNNSLVNGLDSIFKIVKIDHPAFVTVYFTNDKKQFITRSDLLLFPGDSLHLYLDLDNENMNSIIYGGDNCRGQELFNEINYQPYNKFIPVFKTLSKLPKNKKRFVEDIEDIVLEVKLRFDTLQKVSLITEDFAEYINVCFRSLIFNQVVSSLLKESSARDVLSRNERDSIIEILFKIQPATDKRLKGLYGDELYLKNYYSFLTYKKLNLNSINDLDDKTREYHINGNDYLIKEDFIQFSYIENRKDAEDLWALRILLFFNYPGKYDYSVIDQFDSIFPDNKWTPLLVKKFQGMDLVKNINYKLQSPINFIDTNGCNNLNDLFLKLPKNKAVFVDLWATWCGYCISAFGFNSQLDSFLINNNINKLYISLDSRNDYEKWKQAINKYALGGYHILASKDLKEDIRKIIYHVDENYGMGIPRYLLIYKGKIINDNLIAPTELELLKEEIIKELQVNVYNEDGK